LKPRPSNACEDRGREAHFIENEFGKGEWTDEIVLAIRNQQWQRREVDERG
jgi:hypothetical protein